MNTNTGKPTPGPWTLNPQPVPSGFIVGPNIAKVTKLADAALIAASPELLAACKAALVSMLDDEFYDRFPEVRETLRKAIDKAEGR